MTDPKSLAGEPRTRLVDPFCSTCGGRAVALLEVCTLEVPLVHADADVFIYDHALGDVEKAGDETDAVRVRCENGHYWTTDHTDLGA